jgi:hypothetical protein
VESLFSGVDQREDRISGLEDKVDILKQSGEEKLKKRSMSGRWNTCGTHLKITVIMGMGEKRCKLMG